MLRSIILRDTHACDSANYFKLEIISFHGQKLITKIATGGG